MDGISQGLWCRQGAVPVLVETLNAADKANWHASPAGTCIGSKRVSYDARIGDFLGRLRRVLRAETNGCRRNAGNGSPGSNKRAIYFGSRGRSTNWACG